jgi:ABC-type multidrug transport system ATPase subunit
MNQLDDGTIKIFGQKVSFEKTSRFSQIIGYMPQETALVPELTIKETLNYFGNIYQMNPTLLKQRLALICDLLELKDVHKRIEHLSGGEKRRASFGAALLHNPKIVILDEPTVGLDSILREKIWTFLIDSTKSSDMTVIITTHYIAEAEKSNVCGLMKNGKLMIEDCPDNIYKKLKVADLEGAFYELCRSEKSILNSDFTERSSIDSKSSKNQLTDEIIEVKRTFDNQILKALLVKEFLRIRRQPA